MVDAHLSQNPRNLAFRACQHCKTAGEGLLGLGSPDVIRTPVQQSEAKREMLKKLLQIGLAGAGIGIGGRSLLGMKNLLSPAEAPDPYAYTSPIPTPVGIPTRREDEEEKRAAGNEPDLLGRVAEGVLPKSLPPVANPLATGAGIPAAAGMAAAGVGGGWWLTDYIMRRRRQAQSDDEMAGAEQEYQDAMAEQYRAAMRNKAAGDDLGIDSLFDLCHSPEMTKVAAGPLDTVEGGYKGLLGTSTVEKLKGVFGLAALVTGGGAAYATYDWTKNRSRKAMLDKAIRARARMRQSGTPVPMMAMPTPVEV